MTRESGTAWAAAIVTLGLMGVFSLFSDSAMWGLNPLAFLPRWWLWALLATAVVATVLTFIPNVGTRLPVDPWRDFARRIWSPYAEIALSLSFGLLFYRLISETHFLGDGYTLISVYGVEGSIIRRWPEPGSYFLVRIVQHLLGGENRATLIQAMQLLSIGSGVVYVFCALRLPRYLSDSVRFRALISITLIASGTMLMFFGYVEYYHVLWAVGMIYLTLAVRQLRTGRGLTVTVIFAALAALIHFQAVVLLPGTALLIFLKYSPARVPGLLEILRRRWLPWVGLGIGVLGTAVLDHLAHTSIFLTILPRGGETHGYTLFSGVHLLDLINETLVIYPGVLLLAAIILASRPPRSQDYLTTFLGLSSFGALLFVLTVNPVLGMARDWDLMSFALLPIGLYTLHRYSGRLKLVAPRVILTYLLVGAFATATFVATNVKREPSEARFAAFLRYYGSMEESGWAILDYYYLNQKHPADALALSTEMLARGIREADAHYAMGVAYRSQHQTSAAVSHLESASRLKPDNPRWLNELGQAYLDQGRSADAVAALRKSRRLAPEWSSPLESLALVAIRQGDDQAALAYADTLFLRDPNSPGGNLIYMVVELNRGDKVTAEQYYENYLKYGKERSDYAGIREYYGPRFR